MTKLIRLSCPTLHKKPQDILCAINSGEFKNILRALLNYHLCLIIALEKRKTMFTLHLSTISVVFKYLLTYPLNLNTICLAGKTKGPSTYYIITFLEPFLTHPSTSAKPVLNVSKILPFTGTTQPVLCGRNIWMVLKLVKHVCL